mmetsp:Transcript_64076/g.152818  ORF Transcript_64076/g.152818 Transcript_64076/m.152818 type:complete len:157 (-) Transcript_64076:105-575(-)
MGCANSSTGASTQIKSTQNAIPDRIEMKIVVNKKSLVHYQSQNGSSRTSSRTSSHSDLSRSKDEGCNYDSMKPSPVGVGKPDGKVVVAPNYRTQKLYEAELNRTLHYVEEHPEALLVAVNRLRKTMDKEGAAAEAAALRQKEKGETAAAGQHTISL